jgi:hypothetical protein
MSILVGVAYVVGFAVAAAVLAYVVTVVVQTGKWYLRRRGVANTFGIYKGLSVNEVQDRVPGVWKDWDSEWTDNGEVTRCSCTLEGGPVLLFYFLRGQLFSWHADVEPIDREKRD